eukprot:PhM_4_TR8435/c1_g6_i1/m.4102
MAGATNIALRPHFRLRQVNHRHYFVDPQTGVHTNTIESMNGFLKRSLKRRGWALGRGVKRGYRAQFIAEVVNGTLKVNKTTPHARVLRAIQLSCRNAKINDW